MKEFSLELHSLVAQMWRGEAYLVGLSITNNPVQTKGPFCPSAYVREGHLPALAVSSLVIICFILTELKNSSVGCWWLSLRKLFLSYENISYPYRAYYVPGINESVKQIRVYLMLLTTHKVSTFIPSSQLRRLRHRELVYLT